MYLVLAQVLTSHELQYFSLKLPRLLSDFVVMFLTEHFVHFMLKLLVSFVIFDALEVCDVYLEGSIRVYILFTIGCVLPRVQSLRLVP